MKLAEVIIKPLSAFGTPLKADTIFGHFCWQIAYDSSLIKGDFAQWMDVYSSEPFVVLSSAYPRAVEENGRITWFLKRPALPLHFFQETNENCYERIKRRKREKKKIWMALFEEDKVIDLERVEFLDSLKLCRRVLGEEIATGGIEKKVFQFHNSINRITGSTGEGFAPYSLENIWFREGLELSIFALFMEEALDMELLRVAFERIGKMGYGRDSSLGLGRFKVENVRELSFPEPSESVCTLGPSVPRREKIEKMWALPFVRFGRHGGPLATSSNPFKEPVVMADEGAVIRGKAPLGPYIGQAVMGISKVQKEAVIQGYSIVFPLELPGGIGER